MDAILRRALRRVFLRVPRGDAPARIYGNLYRFLLGNDVFVSYGRADGTRYPEALVRRLAREGLVCYYDRLGSPPGTTVSPKVLAQARNSSMLVVVAGPAAAASENVGQEISELRPADRPVIPIDFEGALRTATWYGLVPGITEEREPLSALSEGVVADEVVQRIVGAEDFVSRSRRLRQVFAWVAGGVAAIVLAGALVLHLVTVRAEDRLWVADVAQEGAARGVWWSERRAREAREQARLADEDAIRARTDRDSARHDAGLARGEAVRQERLAAAIGGVNRAEVLRNRDLDSLYESVRLAAKSLRQLTELSTTNLNADRTLRWGLELVRPCTARIASRREAKALAFSQDGRFVALCGEAIEVWGLAGQPRKIGSLADPTGGCRAMAFQPGRLSITGYDGSLWTCEAWDTSDPHCRKLGVYEGSLAAFSPAGGRFVAVDPAAKSVQVWNLSDREESSSLVALKDLPGEIRTETLVRTGPLALAGGALAIVTSPEWDSETVHVFDAERGIEDVSFQAVGKKTSTSVGTVALSRDGTKLAAAVVDRGPGPDNEVIIWDVISKHELARLPMRDGAPEALAFSPDGRTLATGDRFRVRLWDLSNQAEIARLPGGGQELAFSADGSSLAALGRIGFDAVRVWDLRDDPLDAPLRELGVGSRVALSRNGRYFAAATFDRVQVWEIRTAKRIIDQRLSGGLRGYVSFSPTGAYLAGDFGDQSWMLEIPSGRRVPMPSLYSVNVSFDRQERWFAVFGRDRIEVRRTGDERPRVEIPVDHLMLAGALSPQGNYFAMMGPDRGHSLEVWSLDLERGRARRIERLPLKGMLRSLAWSADEGHLAASFDGGFAVIRTAGPRPIVVAALHAPVSAYAFSPRGDRLVAARRDGTQWVCDLRGACPSWVSTYSAKPVRLALDAPGRYAAAALEDGTIEVWDLMLHRRVSHFEHGLTVTDLAFSADGRLVGTVGGSVRRWLWRPEDLIQEAWRRLGESPRP